MQRGTHVLSFNVDLEPSPGWNFREPKCACFPSQGHQNKVATVAKYLCVSYFVAMYWTHYLYASKCHDTDFLMSWTDVDLFLVRSGKQSFLRKSSLCGSLPVDSQDGLQNFHGKQILNCWSPGRFKETDLANVGTRSNVSKIKSQWSTTNKYMRGLTILSIAQDNIFPVSLLFSIIV